MSAPINAAAPRIVSPSTPRHRPRRRLGAVVAAAALLAACGGSGEGGSSRSDASDSVDRTVEHGTALVREGSPRRGGTITFGIGSETNGWDTATAQFADAGMTVASTIFEPLIAYDREGIGTCWLCESFTSNPTGDVWTLKLRANDDGEPLIQFHNGEPLDAAAVKKNLDYQEVAGLARVAIEDWYGGSEVIDALTVRITLEKPWLTYWTNLTGQTGMMMAPAQIDDPDGASNPIGTGPFVFEEWIREDHLTVRRNADYWKKDAQGASLPYLDGIEFRVNTDPQSRITAMESGEYDLTVTNVATDILRLRDAEDLVSIEDFDSEETFIYLNMAKAPFDDIDARTALILATDQNAIVNTIGAGLARVADSPYADGTRWAVDDAGYPAFDLEGARAAVARYEARHGEPLRFELTGLPDSEALKLNQQLASMWAAAGIEAEIDSLEQTQYILKVALGEFQAAWFRNYAYTDPDFHFYFFHSSQAHPPGELSVNFAHMNSDALDEAMMDGRTTTDPAARKDAYARSVTALNETRSHVWLFSTPYALVARPNVHGLNPVREFGAIASFEPKLWLPGVWLE